MPQQRVAIRPTQRAGQDIDLTVAADQLQPGDFALRMPEHLIITLASVFEDEAVAELLNDGKLSELACLTLYLMYEKKQGKSSRWHHYIKELDRQRGRGTMGSRSPLLWDEGQCERLLAGSPVVQMVHDRLKGIEHEYQELDTVWFMAGSLFNKYPGDLPTEAFSLDLFTQAFAAVQGSVVHLQGVPLSKRFAMVPMGPPLLAYSSTCKAMLQYDATAEEVQLVVDRSYRRGDPVYAWCGPQPNQRLLLNYGVVDEDNPNDRLPLTATISTNDPLLQAKRGALQQHGLATQQAFQLQRHQDLPPKLLAYLRLAQCQDAAQLQQCSAGLASCQPLGDQRQEQRALQCLAGCLQDRLSRYQTTVEQDAAVIADPQAGPREKVAARLLRIEKAILTDALAKLCGLPGGSQAVEAAKLHRPRSDTLAATLA